MAETQTKIIPAEKLEELRQESRDRPSESRLDVDVVFEDESAGRLPKADPSGDGETESSSRMTIPHDGGPAPAPRPSELATAPALPEPTVPAVPATEGTRGPLESAFDLLPPKAPPKAP